MNFLERIKKLGKSEAFIFGDDKEQWITLDLDALMDLLREKKTTVEEKKTLNLDKKLQN